MVPSNASAAMADGLGQGRVRVDGEPDVGGVGAHLDGQRGLGDQVAGVGADDAAADDPVGGLVEEHLGHALVAAERQRAAAGGPGEHALAVLDPGRLGLVLGDADPGDLGVGVGDRRDDRGVEVAVAARRRPRRRPCPRARPCARASAGRRRRRWRRCAATLVRCCLSTGMKPRSSTATPAASAPIELAVGPAPDRDQDLVEHRVSAPSAPCSRPRRTRSARPAPASTSVTLVSARSPRSAWRSAWPAA